MWNTSEETLETQTDHKRVNGKDKSDKLFSKEEIKKRIWFLEMISNQNEQMHVEIRDWKSNIVSRNAPIELSLKDLGKKSYKRIKSGKTKEKS